MYIALARQQKHKDKILNCKPSRQTETDWLIEHSMKAGVMAAEPALPASKDLRQAWWKIGNQETTGACVGWATADSLLRWHFVKAQEIPKDKLVSPRFIWMASKETDEFIKAPTTFIETEGTSLKAALDIARMFGAVTDSVLSFESGKLYPGQVETFYSIAAKLKIASYFNLRPPGSSDWSKIMIDWRKWIASNGPILTRLVVDETWDNVKANGNLDAYNEYPDGHPRKGGHAVALVGYTQDRFIVRNSWGTTWGDNGYGYASLAYSDTAFIEAYGITL
jgi:Papain family cysteine protease